MVALMEQRVNFAGIPVDVLTCISLAETMGDLIESGKTGQLIFTLNAEGLFRAKEDPQFCRILLQADLIHADGMPIVWFSPLFGQKLPEKLTTTDVVHPIAEYSVRRGYSFFLLGGAAGVAKQAAVALTASHPGLQVIGTHHGYLKDSRQEERVIQEINRLRPDVLWVGMGRPKQELWAVKNRDCLQVPVIKTCGGLFDFVSGRVPRGPQWMTDNGFEWLYRLLTEPKRLWRRYLIGNLKFLWYVFRYKAAGY